MKSTERWGVWCEAPPKHMQGSGGALGTESDWATGPDGVLVLYEPVAKHLADHWNVLLPHMKHTARRFVDGPPDREDDES